ncbi:MAG: glycosyltransferase family 4 protein [Deltaproteobacteria bacterium]|nr:glycosyltransferase family 4 protein [Deltaproteobacteria bacterium]
MDKATYDVELACAPEGRLIDLVESHGMRVWPIRNLVQSLNPVKDLAALLDLTVFLLKHRYHIVHTHNSKAGFIGRLAGKLASIPVVIHTVHGFAFHDQEPLWKRKLLLNLERLASRWCDRMIFISQPLIDWGLREGVVNAKKVVKIYSGIELDRFRPASKKEEAFLKKKWGIKPQEPVVGIVSKLWNGKGHSVLIHAFEKVIRDAGNARLMIVGEGYLQKDLERLVSKKGLEGKVLFTGFQMNVRDIMACFDVAILPSFFEGMGRVLLEAMAMKKPVVGSRVGGIPELIEDGVNGFLVDPGNIDQLAAAILRILKDRGLAKKMGAAGRKKIQDKFSADYMVASIDRVYSELLAKKGIRNADR